MPSDPPKEKRIGSLIEVTTVGGETFLRLAQVRQSIGGITQLPLADIDEMEARKHDLDYQMALCTRIMGEGDILPFPFERAAVLLHEAKRYEEELALCSYVRDYCEMAERTHDGHSAMIWKSPRLERCIARIPKVKAKLQKS